MFGSSTKCKCECHYHDNMRKDDNVEYFSPGVVYIKKINGMIPRIEWYLNGKLHREDGPAVERSNGIKEWYYHGELYRVEGTTPKTNVGDIHRTDYGLVRVKDINTLKK